MIDLENPPGTRSMPAATQRAARVMLEDAVGHGGVSSRGWTRHSILAASLGAAVLVGGGTAAAYVTLRPAPVTDKSVVHCYAKASLTGGPSVGTDIGMPGRAPDSGPVPIQHAVAACAAMWRSGVLPDSHKYAQSQVSYAVPPLAGCTLPDGTAAVFPGRTGTCARLGLSAIGHGTQPHTGS